MAAGRPPTSTAIKKLKGTFRADRAIANEMMPSKMDYAPSPPPYLSKDAKKEWKSVCTELVSLEMLHRVDLALLSAYCQEMSNYIEAVRALKTGGFVNTIFREDGSAYSMPSPWVAIKNSALKNALSIAGQFGFTPSGRTKIKGEPKEPEDPFEKAMRMA